MGRPSTYDETKDYGKMAEDYLQTCGREQTKLPKISEFCREYIKADEDTVAEWMKGEDIPEGAKVEHLIGAIKRVKAAQQEQLEDDGLYGGKEVNNAMAIFLLKANHNMIETERRELTGKDGSPLGVVVLPEQYGDNLEKPTGTADGSTPKE